jgi:hypothetical protein
LALFVWAEPGSGEVHVNLRGYPGRTTVPTCVKKDTNGSRVVKTRIPCFADPRGTVRRNGITATVYTVNQDADLWHVLYAWRYRGGLYTVSQHVAHRQPSRGCTRTRLSRIRSRLAITFW